MTGTLAAGTEDADLIRATFPPGSVTGALKVRALEIIRELEAAPREAYIGAIGYRSLAGLELNLAIRTFEFHGGHVWLGSGGGITARSDPDAEYRECLSKAAPLIRAFGATFSESPALEHAPRPRPGLTAAEAAATRRCGRRPARWPEPSARPQADRPAIVLIDNYDSFTYNLAHMLLSAGCQVEVVRNDEVSARDIALFGRDGIVISPGPGTPADAGVSIAVVRDRGLVAPLVGVCLGHQAIAAAHGAVITTAPEPVHGQATPVAHDGRGSLTGLPRPFPAGRYHSLSVAEGMLPRDLNVTARGPVGIPRACGTQPIRPRASSSTPNPFSRPTAAPSSATFSRPYIEGLLLARASWVTIASRRRKTRDMFLIRASSPGLAWVRVSKNKSGRVRLGTPRRRTVSVPTTGEIVK